MILPLDLQSLVTAQIDNEYVTFKLAKNTAPFIFKRPYIIYHRFRNTIAQSFHIANSFTCVRA